MKGIAEWTKSTLKKMEKAGTSRVPIQTYCFGNPLRTCSGTRIGSLFTITALGLTVMVGLRNNLS